MKYGWQAVSENRMNKEEGEIISVWKTTELENMIAAKCTEIFQAARCQDLK